MSQFDLAIPFVIKHEGGLFYDPVDPGGITNHGISMQFLKSLARQYPEIIPELDTNQNHLLDTSDVKALTLDKCIHFYQIYWWDQYGYGNIQDQALANKVFDLSVNLGPKVAITLLQKTYNQSQNSLALAIDGVLGPQTLQKINALNQEQIKALLNTFCDLAADYYRNLVKKHPVLKKFLKGWLKRAYEGNSQVNSQVN